MNFFKSYNENDMSDFAALFKQHKLVHVTLDHELVPDLDTYYRKLALQCGIPLVYEEDPVSGAIRMNKWTEIKYDPEKSADAYKHSNKAQPLHTDYGYFSFEMYAAFFYCVTQAEFGGATTFIDVDTIVSVLKNVNQPLFNRIQQQQIHFGRNGNPIASNDDYILQKDEIGWKINWNYYRALEDTEHRALVEEFRDFLDTYIEKSGELKAIKLNPGEGVFFHDRRVLHGRNSFVGQRQLNKGGIATELPQEVRNLISRLNV